MQHPTEAPAIWWDAKARPNLQSLSIRSGIGTPLRQVDMGGKAGDSVTERLGRPSKALLLPAECCLLLKSTIWATFPQWIRCRAPRVFETQTYDDPAVLPLIARDHWEFLETNSAAAIMRAVCPSEWNDIVQVLSTYRLNPESWLKAGGNRGDIAEQIDAEFAKRGWREARLDLETTGILYSKNDVLIDRLPPVRQEGYLVDNYKGRVVVDVEWNAKDGNLDRDLASYRSWHEAGVISAAVIVTKDRPRLLTLARRIWADYQATLPAERRTGKLPIDLTTSTVTAFDKAQMRVRRGVMGTCPILIVAASERTWNGMPFR